MNMLDKLLGTTDGKHDLSWAPIHWAHVSFILLRMQVLIHLPKNSVFMSFHNSDNLGNRDFVIFYFYYNINIHSYGQLLFLFFIAFL